MADDQSHGDAAVEAVEGDRPDIGLSDKDAQPEGGEPNQPGGQATAHQEPPEPRESEATEPPTE